MESDGGRHLSYDFWWHLGHDTMITSEWGPNMIEEGVVPELLLGGEARSRAPRVGPGYRRHVQTLDLGAEQQMVLELRPAHDPAETYGFAGGDIAGRPVALDDPYWKVATATARGRCGR